MKIEGTHSNQQSMASQKVKGTEAALQNRIRAVQQELNQLEQKDELSKTEQEKRKELEKELTELQQQLYNVKNERMKEEQQEERPLKEEGKGGLVDEQI